MKTPRKIVIIVSAVVLALLLVRAGSIASQGMGPRKSAKSDYTVILVLNTGIAFVNQMMSPLGLIIIAGCSGAFMATGKKE